MPNLPLVAMIHFKGFGAGQEKYAPVSPELWRHISVGFVEDFHDLRFIAVHIFEPCFEGFGVVNSIHDPMA